MGTDPYSTRPDYTPAPPENPAFAGDCGFHHAGSPWDEGQVGTITILKYDDTNDTLLHPPILFSITSRIWGHAKGQTMMEIPHSILIFGDVAMAMLLGGLIGLEREQAEKPAGLRTHMLVAGGSALLVGLIPPLIEYAAAAEPPGILRSDPIRMVQTIITGISFLGAGTIIQRSKAGEVKGLTTAASVFFAAAIGIAVGLREFVLAGTVTLLALLALRGVGKIEAKMSAAHHRHEDARHPEPGTESETPAPAKSARQKNGTKS